ncbi:MAG: hypothetical protein L0G49_00725 [Luteococcus sp.]|uniref:hypothetical protein n=1 Tax=Luteococcus sp. TaxID=1969402 RepID=UPI00264A089D|nr:hypothetical protein [Luteococcus sp.]MDN5562296.1 hypothetical protein [Luteococcus sp.]
MRQDGSDRQPSQRGTGFGAGVVGRRCRVTHCCDTECGNTQRGNTQCGNTQCGNTQCGNTQWVHERFTECDAQCAAGRVDEGGYHGCPGA